jgi:hypothetical protein
MGTLISSITEKVDEDAVCATAGAGLASDSAVAAASAVRAIGGQRVMEFSGSAAARDSGGLSTLTAFLFL